MTEQNISLKQNAFVSFGIYYSQIAIIGGIIMIYVGKFLPEFLSELIFIGIIVFALIKAIGSLKSNDRTIVSSDATLMLNEKVKKQNVLQFKVSDDEVEKVEQIGEDIFAITKKGGDIELIPLSFSLKATRELDLKVRALLCQKYGERAEAISNEEVEEYLKTGEISKEIQNATKVANANGMAGAIVGIIFALIPTAIAILGGLSLICKVLILVLSLIVGGNPES